MKTIRRLVLFIAMVIVVSGVSVNAASVGMKLENPEDGWIRYDDSDIPFYSDEGDWVIGEIFDEGDIFNRDDYWNSTLTHVKDNGTIKFIFSGDKIRLITKLHNSRTDINKIIIDGEEEVFSEYREVEDDSLNLSLVYEKLNLSTGYHICEISMDAPGKYLTIDAIDIDEDGELLSLNTPMNLSAQIYNKNKGIKLSWDEVKDADSYTILRSTSEDDIDNIIETNVTGTTYIDTDVEPGITYYYVVRAVKDKIESIDSNIASAMIEEEESKAVLQIKLSTTDIYEYRVTMKETEKFIKWYINRSDEKGLPFYEFSTESEIDPYIDSNEYLVFDKIVWFKVKEYLE